MKILMVSHEYPPLGGGGGNACMNLAGEYVRDGHEVTVVTAWFPGLARREDADGFHLLRLPAKRKHKEHCSFMEMLDYLRLALREADRLERGERYDICQVFFAIPSGPVGYYLKKRYGLPYVIRFGGGDIPGFQERFGLLYKLLGPFEKILWKNAAFLVANSEGLRRMAADFYDKKPIEVIPNGVDTVAFPPPPDREAFVSASGGTASAKNVSCIDASAIDASGRDASEEQAPGEAVSIGNVCAHEASAEPEAGTPLFRILFVSRLIERKGLQFIIPQLPGLKERIKGGIRLTIVGDGPYRGELEKLAAECGLDEETEFVGQKDKQELPAYYSDADVFILPSKREGMPNVVLEAMASGLPVVMTPCEGSRELIDGNGYVTEAADFSEKLLTLYQDSALRARMGERSLCLIRERFLWNGVAGRYEELFARAEAERRR